MAQTSGGTRRGLKSRAGDDTVRKKWKGGVSAAERMVTG
jgi:hypothetical protein